MNRRGFLGLFGTTLVAAALVPKTIEQVFLKVAEVEPEFSFEDLNAALMQIYPANAIEQMMMQESPFRAALRKGSDKENMREFVRFKCR